MRNSCFYYPIGPKWWFRLWIESTGLFQFRARPGACSTSYGVLISITKVRRRYHCFFYTQDILHANGPTFRNQSLCFMLYDATCLPIQSKGTATNELIYFDHTVMLVHRKPNRRLYLVASYRLGELSLPYIFGIISICIVYSETVCSYISCKFNEACSWISDTYA